MVKDSRFIIIAGTAQNVGKTSLACQLIKHYSQKRKVISVKFISLKKNGKKHLHHEDILTFSIIKEKNITSDKDTSKMLRAGASESFLIISKEAFVSRAISKFKERLGGSDIVIVESAVLRNYIEPLTFVIVDRVTAVNKKTYIELMKPMADYLITDVFDEKSILPLLK